MQKGRSRSWQGRLAHPIKSLKEYVRRKGHMLTLGETEDTKKSKVKKNGRRINSRKMHNEKWK